MRATNQTSVPPRQARIKFKRSTAARKTPILQNKLEGTEQRVSPRLLAAREARGNDAMVPTPAKQRVSGRGGHTATANLAALHPAVRDLGIGYFIVPS